jgi:xanthine dehydrogenase accessory factor
MTTDAPADVLAEAADAGARGEPAALVTVVRATGSTPRHAGAHMLVFAGGRLVGTIGGGRIEKETLDAALPVARGEAPAQAVDRHLTHDLAMCCGGSMTLWIEPLGGARWKALDEVVRRQRARRASALVTTLGGPGGGGKDVRDDHPVIASRRAALDEAGRFAEPILPAPRLVLFGAGHVAHAVAPLAASVGFELAVCDEHEDWATSERFPGATLVDSYDAREAERALGGFGPGDHVIILTRDHAVDQAILEQLLARADLGSLGMIGSRGKLARFKKRLEAKAIGDDAAWARLRSPVGLDIAAETPEEIAVAIVAELVKTRRA